MQLINISLFVVGMYMVIQGIFDEKYDALLNNQKVEYRFVPRSYYEEQMFNKQFTDQLAPIFDEDDQWYYRTTGRNMGVDRKKI